MLAHLAAAGSGWQARVRLFGSADGEIEGPDGSRLRVRPLSAIDAAAVDGAVVVHLAFLTKEKAELLGPTRFFETNERIDDALLAAVESGRPRGLFVASSGAAALAASGSDRHLYGICKLRQEDRFLSYASARGTPVLVGRIFNIAGPYINKFDSYALSSFLVQAFRNGAIRVNATTPVFRSFLSVDDLCAMALGALVRGHRYAAPVDLCGSEVLEMGEIARECARAAGLDERRIERPALTFDTIGSYLGRATDTQALALRCGLKLANFRVQVAETARYVRDRLQAGQCADNGSRYEDAGL